ncbi:MAG TPA: efflux RND transporter permease subunit [Thermoanaerobaculia bacterium]|nr:efflux RND transporter permease subunit [Thermoanaerobaculia bacterium]
MTTGRPLARLVLTLGLIVLGAVALARLPMEYLPRQSFPELTVTLALDDATDPANVTREWLEEIEGAIRSLGRVEEVGGEVRSNGGELTVRFQPGTDPERKAARLESELADLRRRLPGKLWITPASDLEGDLFVIVWIASREASDRDAETAAEELRSIPGVQSVSVYGALQEEVRVEVRGASLDPRSDAEAVRAEVERSLRAPELGRVRLRNQDWPVVVPPSSRIESVPVALGKAAVPLGSLATVREHWKTPRVRVRFEGQPARALFVRLARGASPLGVDRGLRERLEQLPKGLKGTLGWNQAAPLRELAGRLGLGLLLASLLTAAAGGWIGGRPNGGRTALAAGLALPAAVAAAANAFWLAGVGLNVTTLVALAVGAASAIPAALLRSRGRMGFWPLAFVAVTAAAAVPVTVALGSHELGPFLSEPAQAFLLAVVGAMVAAGLVPAPTSASEIVGVRFIAPFRDPGTILLLAATAAYAAAALFGPSLLPKPADLEPDGGSLYIRVLLPEGTPIDEAERRVKEVEEQLADAPEVEGFWSRASEIDGFVVADIRREDRRPERLERLITRLRYRVPASGALVIRTAGPAGDSRARSLEDRPETDEEANTYRAVLRSADLPALIEGYDRILNRLNGLKVRPYWITRHDTRSVRLTLRPRPASPPEQSAALAALLRRDSSEPRTLRLPRVGPGERTLLVAAAGAPTDPDRVPQLSELLAHPLLWQGRPVLPASAVTIGEEVLLPKVARQSGRFVLPVDLRIGLNGEDVRLAKRKEIDRSLGQLALPTGADLERPSLAPGIWQSERVRLAALAAAVPLLLFAVAACRLGSLLRGLAALAPLALGLVAAAPVVSWDLRQADELTVFALGAGLALALPAVAQGTLSSPGSRPSRLYRALRRETSWMLGAVPALLLGLVVPTLGLDPLQLRWVTPLRVAAASGGTALLASILLSPALLLLGRGAAERVRRPEEVRRRQRPPAWSASGLPDLEVRSVTKSYGGKVTALSGVRFELTPGIVGLLGPNGAGKTTLLRILTGLLEPTRGEVLFRGVAVTPENLSDYRRQIGFLPQEFNAYPELTAEQFLDHWAIERGMGEAERRREIEKLLDAVGLAEHARRKVRDFSGGMRQRVGIARALLGAPPILIVDEPTTGLDVESRARFRQILLEQAADRVVLFSTHIASDVEAAASRILLLHRGRLRFDGTPEELVDRARGRAFRALIGDADLAEFGRRYRVTARVRTLEGIKVRAVARPGDTAGGEVVEPNLEEAYLAEIDLADAER